MDRKRKYAKFLIEGCLKLKEGDKLFIIASNFIIDFVNLVKEEANKLGIKDIETLISYPEEQRELYLNNDYEDIIKSPLVDRSKFNKMAREGYAFLNLSSPLPNYFDEVDEELLVKINRFQAESIDEYREYQQKGLIKWNISAVANEIWAKSLDKVKDIDQLWEYIFNICLINDEDPIVLWEEKMLKLKNRANYLNSLNIVKLKYKNSLGTDLEIGLPDNYLFQSADGVNIVNMPTEEVFSSPNKFKVKGCVYACKILLYNGSVIQDFWLEFKDGRIINYDALKGKEALRGIIETDDGSHYLGEVAIVDFASPISQTNVIFKNTLYDENAACHLAIGESFPECIRDGLTMNNKELEDRGLNHSHVHVDFFIGTKDLEIKAVLKNGEEIVIMENGNFKEA